MSDMTEAASETFEPGIPRAAHVILAGVDGTPASLRAAAYAAGLARRQRAQLVCVYVRPQVLPSVAAAACMAPAIIPAAADVLTGIEDDVRERVTADAAAWGLPACLLVRTGDPLTELTAIAGEVGADAIVIGASASYGHRLFGSLGSRLLRQRRWPVTVVP
jgi:nucleotide-binding universal stress UspA family protein